jgi:hypothetical protein
VNTDLFSEPTLVGLKVRLARPVDIENPCCENICTILPGQGPHAGELVCTDCHRHRGWLSKTTADWLMGVVSKFGAPDSPIVVRRARTYKEHERACFVCDRGEEAGQMELATYVGAPVKGVLVHRGCWAAFFERIDQGLSVPTTSEEAPATATSP